MKLFFTRFVESASLASEMSVALPRTTSVRCWRSSDTAAAALQYEKEKAIMQKKHAKLTRKLERSEATNKALTYMLNDLIGSEEAPGKAIVRVRDDASKKAVEDYLASSEYAELLKENESKMCAQVFEEVMGYFKKVTFTDIFGHIASSSTSHAEARLA